MTVIRQRSPFIGDVEPITESDDELRAVLEDADLPALLPALAYTTGTSRCCVTSSARTRR